MLGSLRDYIGDEIRMSQNDGQPPPIQIVHQEHVCAQVR